MEYVRLGKTDLLISRVAFGAMRLSDASSDEEAAKIVRTAYDAGIFLMFRIRLRPAKNCLERPSLTLSATYSLLLPLPEKPLQS